MSVVEEERTWLRAVHLHQLNSFSFFYVRPFESARWERTLLETHSLQPNMKIKFYLQSDHLRQLYQDHSIDVGLNYSIYPWNIIENGKWIRNGILEERLTATDRNDQMQEFQVFSFD